MSNARAASSPVTRKMADATSRPAVYPPKRLSMAAPQGYRIGRRDANSRARACARGGRPLASTESVPDPIVEDELRLLAGVNATLEATPAPAPPSEASLVQELEHLRDALREGSKTD